MFQESSISSGFSWRTLGALFFFFSAIVGFELGVSVTERPDVVDSSILTKAYFSLSLFVVGGVDLGTPNGGPLIGRILLWASYFGSPILAAWTLIATVLRAIAPQRWYLRRLKDHIVVVGDGELALITLRTLRQQNSKVAIVVVSSNPDPAVVGEFSQSFHATVVTGDITHRYFLKQLNLNSARKILLLDDNSLRSYEAASTLLRQFPGIGDRVVIHCENLRFMRAMENTHVAQQCQTFNTYHLAASGLVRSHLLHHFRETRAKDVVVLAGFGRFGQTVLEELQRCAIDELDTVIIIDIDAHRRVLIADEQMVFSGEYKRVLFEGDISHPEVWDRVEREAKLKGENTVFVLGTGREEDNLRISLGLRQKYPGAMIISRSSKESLFATEVGLEHEILSVSITQLVEDNLPRSWLSLD
ncbi:MAG: voltage-gated potassium channel Kch [Halioglobus sp.]|jgi:voltage-gated potassium channel Kch